MTEPWFVIVMSIIEERYAFFIGALIFVAFDTISGLIKAFAMNTFSSTKVKEGIFHKAALILIMVMSVVIDILSGFIPSMPFTVPLTQGCCLLIIGMECMSVLENVCAINPALKDSALIKRLLPTNEEE